MKCYVSHPIKGKSEEDIQRLEQFGAHFADHALGMTPVLPRTIPVWSHEGRDCPPGLSADDSHAHACYMRSDLIEMLKCDTVLMMPGWESSAGCRAELDAALAAGLVVHFYHTSTQMERTQ